MPSAPLPPLAAIRCSGTSIIAAETISRTCLAIESDPLYVDVAITRWQEFAGREASRKTASVLRLLSRAPLRLPLSEWSARALRDQPALLFGECRADGS